MEAEALKAPDLRVSRTIHVWNWENWGWKQKHDQINLDIIWIQAIQASKLKMLKKSGCGFWKPPTCWLFNLLFHGSHVWSTNFWVVYCSFSVSFWPTPLGMCQTQWKMMGVAQCRCNKFMSSKTHFWGGFLVKREWPMLRVLTMHPPETKCETWELSDEFPFYSLPFVGFHTPGVNSWPFPKFERLYGDGSKPIIAYYRIWENKH